MHERKNANAPNAAGGSPGQKGVEGAIAMAAPCQPVEVHEVVVVAQLLAAPCICQSLQILSITGWSCCRGLPPEV